MDCFRKRVVGTLHTWLCRYLLVAGLCCLVKHKICNIDRCQRQSKISGVVVKAQDVSRIIQNNNSRKYQHRNFMIPSDSEMHFLWSEENLQIIFRKYYFTISFTAYIELVRNQEVFCNRGWSVSKFRFGSVLHFSIFGFRFGFG